ncbi:GntR family transcriptional regulator [Lactobacillus psittaci]|uniref:Transcriptional regulator n=1 Tax=Lactobacillus psittaci DSM 15354 TaxID=1122152 RepID=A0A0R1S353_9LACO|nr:GntR family transcriptional regulator [Lactobacillus psittaci]KRL62020.1 transcriptional regulator [Lactobacillus psittaci DSM 15354]
MSKKYEVLVSQLKQKILEGEYKVDDQLPRELEIASAYNVSRITVRRALAELEKAGLIYRVQGSGTFVKGIISSDWKQNQKNFELINFEENKAELVSFSISKIYQPEIKSDLGLNDFDLVYKVKRIIKRKNVIVAIQKIYLPSKIVQGIRADVLVNSIYDFIRNDLNLEPKKITRTFSNVKANTETEEFFQTDTPLVEAKQISYLQNGNAFEYNQTIFKLDSFKLNEVIIS